MKFGQVFALLFLSLSHASVHACSCAPKAGQPGSRCDAFEVSPDGTTATCSGENACRNTVISGCKKVTCVGNFFQKNACDRVTFINTKDVECSGQFVCGRITTTDADSVTCRESSCSGAKLEQVKDVNCIGQFTCPNVVISDAETVSCTEGSDNCIAIEISTAKKVDCQGSSCGASKMTGIDEVICDTGCGSRTEMAAKKSIDCNRGCRFGAKLFAPIITCTGPGGCSSSNQNVVEITANVVTCDNDSCRGNVKINSDCLQCIVDDGVDDETCLSQELRTSDTIDEPVPVFTCQHTDPTLPFNPISCIEKSQQGCGSNNVPSTRCVCAPKPGFNGGCDGFEQDGLSGTCNEEEACSDAIISGCQTLNCNGFQSCLNTNFVSVRETKCEGSFSCFGANISGGEISFCSGSNSCDGVDIENTHSVFCFGRKSCTEASITGANNIVCVDESCEIAELKPVISAKCTGDLSCSKAAISGGETVTCDGKEACVNAIISGCQLLTCNGIFACADTDLVGVKDLKCVGDDSCHAVTSDSTELIECFGFESCTDMTITGAVTVKCTGDSEVCDGSTISADDIICRGDDSCAGTKLTANKISCDGKNACESISLIATSSVTCSGPSACAQPSDSRDSTIVIIANTVICDNNSCRGNVYIESECLQCIFDDGDSDTTCLGFNDASNDPPICKNTDATSEEGLSFPCRENSEVCEVPTDPPTASPTSPPTDAPNDDNAPPPRDGGAFGDPHLVSFAGVNFDYMGVCDLILVEATPPLGLSMTDGRQAMPFQIVIRTEARYFYSFIQSAVVAIGEQTLQVFGFGQWILDGISNGDLATGIAGFPITYERVSDKVHSFQIPLENGESITLKTLHDMVSVKIHASGNATKTSMFQGSRGMMGDFNSGLLMTRNGTVVEDPNELALEWQVQQDEPMLFQSVRDPQHPVQCFVPQQTTENSRRRLGSSEITKDAAIQACSSWPVELQSSCLHDVIAMGSLDVAKEGPF